MDQISTLNPSTPTQISVHPDRLRKSEALILSVNQ